MSETIETKKELSQEEIKAMQGKMDSFYDERLPFLRKQCEYEELTARIETARFTRNEAMYKSAQLSIHIQNSQPVKPTESSNS